MGGGRDGHDSWAREEQPTGRMGGEWGERDLFRAVWNAPHPIYIYMFCCFLGSHLRPFT